MQEIANTTVSILRGTGRNRFGDDVDTGMPVYTGISAYLGERSKQAFDPASRTPRTVRDIVCVVPSWTDVRTTDQIKDERTGVLYAIEDVLNPPSLMGAPVDEILTLRRVTGTTT
ncbi:hypothetical protein [Actinoallomurus sp. NPDC052274]|uniref:hypothetical protein n=1 Tax=Actinoallomurus sp. NPDC052274 TaxID=3155420 RepID=UPI003412DF21